MTNEDLRTAVEQAIKESGYKKIWIAEQLGMSKQALYKLIKKQNLSLDDANRILTLIGCDIKFEIIKRDTKQ